MSCELCGGGDMWIKTCRTHEGSRLLVCDECYGENTSVLGDRAWRQGGDGEVRPLLALRQSEGVRGDQPWRTQERLLG
jgi:ribosome-binding protein aMBF1 (putative translation factor)